MNFRKEGLDNLARHLLRHFGAWYISGQLALLYVGDALHTLSGCVPGRAEVVSQPRCYSDLRRRQGSTAGAHWRARSLSENLADSFRFEVSSRGRQIVSAELLEHWHPSWVLASLALRLSSVSACVIHVTRWRSSP